MPLQPCRECGYQVSTEARACPGCGARWPVEGHAPTTSTRRAGLVLVSVALFFAYVAIIGRHRAWTPCGAVVEVTAWDIIEREFDDYADDTARSSAREWAQELVAGMGQGECLSRLLNS